MSKVSITFLGGAETVTGSRFLVEYEDKKILIEAGLFQGLKELRLKNWDKFPIEPSSIDAIVISHAHLDHCGYLPLLIKNGFRNSIFLSSNTALLAEIILKDSARIQVEDAKYASKKGFSKHNPPQPLYDENDVQKTLSKFENLKFRTKTEISSNVFVTIFPAGHILGASYILLQIGNKNLLFTGDLGRNQHPILVAPDPLPNLEISALITESTYGARTHESPVEEFTKVINRAVKRGGSILIPAFAVDRTEVILIKLKDLIDQNQIPRIPIYVDSPMALESLHLYRKAVARKDVEIRNEFVDKNFNRDPFDTFTLNEIKSVEDSKSINEPKNSCIIISASGMATGGRVVHHLKHMLPNPLHTILLVGYQAIGTRGHALVNGAEQIKMHGQMVDVKAEISKVEGFSVHADGTELIDWFKKGQKPGKVFIVHGETESAEIFAQRLEIELNWHPIIPKSMQKFEI